MRLFVAALMVMTALAGCTQGDDTPGSFDQSCPAWKQSPGQPGLGIRSFDNGTTTFNLKGISVKQPSLLDPEEIEKGNVVPRYNWDGAVLDVAEFTVHDRNETGGLRSFAVDGYYLIKVYRADMRTPHESDGQTVTYDTKNRHERLGFRDMSKPNAGILTELRLEPDDDFAIGGKTYRIEFAEADEKTNPGDLWIDWQFVSNVDGDQQTASAGALDSTVRWWYRSC